MAKNTTNASDARRHAMPTTIGGYENLLIRMIEKRRAAEFDEFLMPQVCTCAQTWMMCNRVHKEMMKSKSLTSLVMGSQNQQKEEVSPLMPYYLKLQGELRLQFEALGLNYRSTPKKITENTKQGGERQDKLAALLNDLNENT